MNKLEILIQSRGVKQHYDYRWKNLENKLSEEAEKLFNQMVELINAESKSILIIFSEKKYYLLITEISSNINETFSKTLIRINVIFSCQDEFELRKIASVYLKFKNEFEKNIRNELDYSKDDYSINRNFEKTILEFVDSKFISTHNQPQKDLILEEDTELNRIKLAEILISSKLKKSSNLNPIFIITDKIYTNKEIIDKKIKIGIIKTDQNKDLKNDNLINKLILILVLIFIGVAIIFKILQS